MSFRVQRASGLEYLDLVTQLLHRVRLADPTAGLWEAADLQWWWRTARRSDTIDQIIWLDDRGPVAAAPLTEWTRSWGCDPIVLAGAPTEALSLAWAGAVSLIDTLALERVEVRVRDNDPGLPALLLETGFAPTDTEDATLWMAAPDRPAIRPLQAGFEMRDRSQLAERPHHFVGRSGAAVEARLRQTSLYDPELDLAVLSPSGEVAAYGLFWFDPITAVGLVEPMRTEAPYQRLGLARSLLATGLARLADRGATRLKVSYESAAAGELYVGSGFRLESRTRTYARERA